MMPLEQSQSKIDKFYPEFERILSYSKGHDNDIVYAQMLTSLMLNLESMYQRLGLSEQSFKGLIQFHFPELKYDEFMAYGKPIDDNRYDEFEDIYRLLESGTDSIQKTNQWMATIVSTACQGSNHLWQDMGLLNRQLLSDLLFFNFPQLANKNISGMRWKKFFYRQLCQNEGIYICRSPSCEACSEYKECFVIEE